MRQHDVLNLRSILTTDTIASDGRTALHFAAECGREAVISTLLERGAYVSAASIPCGGWHERKFYAVRTPMHWAAAGAHLRVIELLLKNGADPAATNATGRTPLHEAANSGRVEIAELLLDSGADLEAVCAAPDHPSMERHSSTPLILAARLGSVPTVRLLVDRGANVKATNSLGEMAIHEAAFFGYVDILRLLLDAGCNTEERNPARRNETPLHKAASTGMAEVVRMLLMRGASKSTTNCQGQDACQIANNGGHDEVISILSDVSLPKVSESRGDKKSKDLYSVLASQDL